MTRPCGRCGAEVPDGARFCPACGAPQADAPGEERRVVTVLFGDLTGFTELTERHDPEEVKRIIDGAFERVTGIVNAYGGRIDKIIGDEVMAVFGAPRAHEDDPERAVRAALAINRMLEAYSVELSDRDIEVRLHIGINTGEVVAGRVGGSDAYSVIGDAVNMARRIEEEAAAGQILVGETTHEASRGAIEYRRLGHLTVKGKRQPLAIWEAVDERSLPGERVTRPSPLVGRDEELAMLDSFADMVRRDGRPMAIGIIAEAGMGKSRLVDEFARRVASSGGRVLHGRSLPYGTASPAFAVEEIVRAALMLDRSMTTEQTERWITDRLEELGASAESDRIGALLGLRDVPAHDTATGPAATSAPTGGTSALLESARLVIERVAEREGFLALAFHELHHAEDAVLDLVQGLLRATRAPLLVISLARPALLERRPQWSRSLGTALLVLHPLPRERARELLALLAPSIPPRLREDVLDRAGGNPLFLQELARLFTERDERVTPAVPVGLQALVTARLDALPPAAKRVAQDASVIGAEFWPGALVATKPEAAAEVERALRTLRDKGFIEPAGAGPAGEPAFRFAQDLVREVAYGSLPKHRRAEQHEAVARWLGETEREDGETADLIAFHYERAALTAREVGHSLPTAERQARIYLERAGDQARQRDAAPMAAGFYERALAFAGDEADALDLRLHLGESLLAVWRHEAAEEHLRRSLDDARRLGDRRAEAKALRLLGDLYRMRGETERARKPLEQALAIAKQEGDAIEEAEGLRSHGLLDMHRGRWQAATLWFRQSLARYRHPMLADPRGEGWSLQNLGWANMLLGRHDDALEYLKEGERVFAALDDEEGVGWCLSITAWVHLLRGDLDQADGIASMLQQIIEERSGGAASFELDVQRVMRANVAMLSGRFADAEAHANAAIAGSAHYRASWVRALAAYPKVFIAMLRRRFPDARIAFEDGARAADASGDPLFQGQFAFARAWLLLEDGRPQEVAHALEAMMTAGGSSEPESAAARWLLAHAMDALGDRAGARGLLEQSAGRQGIALVPPASARVALAALQLADGDAEAARATAKTAAEEAGAMVIVRAEALRILSAAALAAGDDAAAEQAARDELALLEASDWEIERVRALGALARALDASRRHDEAAEVVDRARALLDRLPPGTDTAGLERALRA